MKNVAMITPDVSFVDALADGLWRQAKSDPLKLSQTLVLLPTRRACRTLREAFLRATGGRAALLPRMQPLGDIDETELSFAPDALDPDLLPAITPLRRQMLLTQLIVKKDATLPLDQAAQLAEALGKLLNQVQTERSDFSRLKNLVPEDLAAHWQETLKFLEIVTAAWPAVLAEEKCLDPADRRNRLLAAQANFWQKNPPSYPVIAAGSTGSLPAVADLLAVIAGLPHGTVVLPGLDTHMDEESWQAIDESHPQYNMKNWLETAGLKRFDVRLWPAAKSLRSARVRLLQEALRPAEATQAWQTLNKHEIPANALKGLSRIELDHLQEEADAIALRLRAALETPEKTAALVTPDRALAERVGAALRRWGIEANDSAGTSLAVLPVGSFLRDVLAAAAPQAAPIDCLSLLKHPLAACSVTESECRRHARLIERHVWRGVRRANGWQGAMRVLLEDEATKSTGEWLSALSGWLENIAATWANKKPLAERISQHVALAERLATTDKLSGAARLWRDEAGEAAVSFLDDWRQAASGFPALTGDDYLRLFTTLLRGITVRPAYGQHPRLSILGPLEARLQHADLVVLGGLNEGVWPPEPAVDPWLSRPMKHKLGLPLPERRIGLSAHDFVQLASASEVLLTRARKNGATPTVPSRFLLQLEAVLQALGYHGNGRDALAPAGPWASWARSLDMPEKSAPCLPPQPCPPLAARPRQLSVTEIGIWRRNPYAIYAKRILRLKPLEDIDADVTAADRGTMIHEALELFLSQHKNTWPAAPLDDLLKIGRDLFAPYKDRPQVIAFWWPRFERIAAWFIATEQTQRQKGFRVLAAECEGTMPFASGTFTLKGRADRIDRLPDGSAMIIDYKTGALPKTKDIALGYEPQLPLLALIAGTGGFPTLGTLSVSALNYWRLHGGSKDEKIKDIKNIPAFVAAARQGLEDLLEKFTDPATAYEAVPKPRFALRYDDYAHLARLAEWGRT
jgi:ATP-dependent helicase/nuclease subunit B